MSTSASITGMYNDLVLDGMNEGRNMFHTITVHNDGYYNTEFSVGQILLRYYNTQEKVDELISMGCASSIGSMLNPDKDKPHSMNHRQEDVCLFYHRDCGEDLEILEYKTEEEMDMDTCEDYNYWFKDGKWYVKRWGDDKWKRLRPINNKHYGGL